ncbi:MAG: hypothetical protein IT480_10860 [Gammaproteobacteria bacterium]|nr:hypothetical protein [Gammaproteobacteria bacterium]
MIHDDSRRSAGRRRSILGSVLLLITAVAAAQRVSVPPELEAWRGWALQGAEYRHCPFLVGRSASDAGAYRCAWPGRLTLSLDARGGQFSQGWQVYAPSWVVLPGDAEHWPQELRVDAAPLAAVLRAGVPQARLEAGRHVLSGRFAWSQRPEQLAVASQSALVELTLDGQRVAQPERPAGAVWLGKRRTAESSRGMDLQVFRLVEDDIPVQLTTRLQLQISGEGREEVLAPPLPAGFTPLRLQSELAARLDAAGRLHVQVRPGHYVIELVARGPGVAGTIARPQGAGAWPREEIWSYAAVDRLRVAAPEGGAAVDPAQAGVPERWRGYPAFRLGAGERLTIVERSRGLGAGDDNHLTLRREQWLDFDHRAYTAVDTVEGRLRSRWRLDMRAPYRLERARSGGEDLLVTELDGQAGVELRTPQLQLSTTSRVPRARGALPASGWSTRFERMSGVLHLPPGHRLLGVPGADEAPGSWWSQWTLWSLFGVLIVVAFTFRIAGRVAAAVALLALALMYQEGPHYIWLWANLLMAVAVARAAAGARFATLTSRYRWASFALLGIALLPFLWGQVRLAIHPQLEDHGLMALQVDRAVRAMPVSRAVTEVMLDQAAPAASAVPAEVPPGAPPPPAAGPRYAPGTLLQTGPGIPSWGYGSYAYSWSGPVEPDDTVRFVFIGPLLLALWRIVGAALLTLWFLWLLQHSAGGGSRWPAWLQRLAGTEPPADRTTRGRSDVSGTAGTLSALVLALSLAWPVPLPAAATPDAAVLQELRNRLLAPPPCEPDCGDVMVARVGVAGERLEITLEVAALANVAVAVPHAADRWQIDSIAVDGAPAVGIGRESDASLWVPLAAGVHRIALQGRLAAVETVRVAFPRRPHAISVTASGWEVAGVSAGRLVSGSLELTRRGAPRSGAALESGAEFPVFVRVTRDFELGIDWTVRTSVERVAPAQAALSVEVPLLATESVLTDGIDLKRRGAQTSVLAGLAAGQQRLSWISALPQAATLQLAVPADAARAEVWNFRVSPQWRVGFQGFPAVLPDDSNAAVWVYQYRPRPGEQLLVQISRPAAAAGATLAIDRASQQVSFGRRSADVALSFDYRSTQGGRHALRLPGDVRVQTVTVDGAELALRPVAGQMWLNLLPGAHSVAVRFESPRGATLRSAATPIDLGAPASNITTTLELPQARWALLATAALGGPVMRYWGELVVFIVTALLLGRWRHSPLRWHEWLLLGLGLSTLSWAVFVLVALWLFALRWRERWRPLAVGRWRFLLVQGALALLTVVAVGSLVFSGIRYGFLSSPDMGLAGAGSYGNTFVWFHDQVPAQLPQVAVYAVPLWIYRLLMFAWALWIALALTRWLHWAWSAWNQDWSRASSSDQRA